MFLLNENNDELQAHVEDIETGVTPDMAGTLDIVMESQATWSNLVTKMMRLEHKAYAQKAQGLVSESAQLLEAGEKSFWQRIVDWIKNAWARIKEFFKKLWDAIVMRFSNIDKFVKANSAKLAAVTNEQLTDLKLKLQNGGNLTDMSAKVEHAISKATVMHEKALQATSGDGATPEDYSLKAVQVAFSSSVGLKSADNFASAVYQYCIGAEAKDVAITKSIVGDALKVLDTWYPKMQSALKAASAGIDKTFHDAEAAAKEGMNRYSNDGAQDKNELRPGESSQSDSGKKRLTARINGCMNAKDGQHIVVTQATKAAGTVQTLAYAICRAALSRAGRGGDAKKTESFDILDSI